MIMPRVSVYKLTILSLGSHGQGVCVCEHDVVASCKYQQHFWSLAQPML
jgi:hypothetical protein